MQDFTCPCTDVRDLGQASQDHETAFATVGKSSHRCVLVCVQCVGEIRQQLLELSTLNRTEFRLPCRATDHQRTHSEAACTITDNGIDRMVKMVRAVHQMVNGTTVELCVEDRQQIAH